MKALGEIIGLTIRVDVHLLGCFIVVLLNLKTILSLFVYSTELKKKKFISGL